MDTKPIMGCPILSNGIVLCDGGYAAATTKAIE